MRVLIVDDHEEVRDLLVRSLRREGHEVLAAATAGEARARFAAGALDVVVLDVALPDGSGIDLCSELRQSGVSTPVLLLTAHAAVPERVAGLDAGADDFLGKPFAVSELRARVRALGRRGPAMRPMETRCGDALLDFRARRAERAGVEVPLTAREWSLLELLAARSGRFVSRGEILELVWGAEVEATASLEVLVARIRRKLGEGVLRTMRGHGYALAVD
ncbi:response regulator transcription factor [Chondromyces apiculatus]|uniref:Two component transcriptional regulator, winged helix family n=1 Tax=Chondromyces apiculatus DSM 436 TaxID=1192034 RepID=A0A017SYV3_9BACT|nr:response regulator transcription factor [Chondromyces apiculatus]EYF01952.1 two component transcriptional regulator, winged helix family [Chondromyces apiculatus DSM 436]